MSDKFGLKIGIEGEKEFKKALSDINQSFKVLGSEMKLAASQFAANDKSMQALSARNAVLNKEIDAQKQKIETLRSALKNASESFGENDRRTQNWQIQLMGFTYNDIHSKDMGVSARLTSWQVCGNLRNFTTTVPGTLDGSWSVWRDISTDISAESSRPYSQLDGSGKLAWRYTGFLDIHLRARLAFPADSSGRAGVFCGTLFCCLNVTTQAVELYDGDTLLGSYSTVITPTPDEALRSKSWTS